jgi:TonB-linked SusC/RagA family outer membrane protein
MWKRETLSNYVMMKKFNFIETGGLRKIAFIFCVCCSSFSLLAQNVNITGVVKDDKGEPIGGVTVVVKGTTRGVITDMDGSYTLRAAPGNVLTFSLLGYQEQSILLETQTTLDVVLLSKADELDEVVLVAFGQQKKSSVVASIETVKMSDLRVPAQNLTNSLAGKIPGIISYQTSGEPGADNAQFFVRGVTTFGYKTSPLILIDGFEATTDDLARLQPDDVESFSILKDASATALYGARGANGIILVMTKSGQEGAVKINVRVDTHVATPTRMNDVVDGIEYMRLYNEARVSRNPTLGVYYTEQKIQSTLRGDNPMIYPNVDWYDELFKNQTINTKANINLSGGGGVATYYVAGGYDNENGLLRVDPRNNFNTNISINRYHIRSNVIFKLTKTTTLDTRVHGRFEKYTGPSIEAANLFSRVMLANPVDFPAVFEPDEANRLTQHTLFGSTTVDGNIKGNPYADMVRGYRGKDESTMTAMATLFQDLDFVTKGLKFQAKASVNIWSKYQQTRTYSPYFYDVESYNAVTGEYVLLGLNPLGGNPYLGDVMPDHDATASYYFEARMNWDRQYGKHSVGAMAVGMAQENLLTGGANLTIYETLPERNLGISGRFTYDYDSRYFLEFDYGYNGSEKFTGKKQFGFFPSVGGGWLVSNEKFWKPMEKIVSSLKLKFTYGLVGNDAIAGRGGRFFYLSDISRGEMDQFQQIPDGYRWGQTFTNLNYGYKISRYANPDISWEVSRKYNLGIELGTLKDALKLQLDYFQDTRSNIYMERENFASTVGLEAKISGNVGKVRSHGIDASLDYQQFFSKDWWMTGRVNFTYAANKYLEMDEREYRDEYLKHVGHNINQEWGLVAERLFVDDEEIRNSPHQDYQEYMAGDIKYKDINGDGVVNNNDRIPMGYPTVPEMQYGFGLSTGYKKFDFSFFFQGNARVSFFIDASDYVDDWGIARGIAPFSGRRNALTIVGNDYWSVSNPNVHAFWPRLSTTPIQNNSEKSSWWLRDGSFLRLKTVEVGYTLPGYEKIGLSNSRVYFSIENLFVVSSFKLWDPEVGAGGLGYPPNRRFNIGIQLSF